MTPDHVYGAGVLAGLALACLVAYAWWLGRQLDKARKRIKALETERETLERQVDRLAELNAWLRGRVVRRRS